MSSMQHAGGLTRFMLHCRRHRPSRASTRRIAEQGRACAGAWISLARVGLTYHHVVILRGEYSERRKKYDIILQFSL